ncbi:hypothetical protein CPC08DRAFT_732699 [Agrocybe pediades]|nr:hypothetical protein CPC08DRAFT_732699 [Agrocybe pediades]
MPRGPGQRRSDSTVDESTASTKAAHNPYPYPTHRNPTPHQLFHLPRDATKSEIKARYYELVRVYHPDRASQTVDPEIAHARFRAITNAYDALNGKIPMNADPLKPHPTAEAHANSEARYRRTAAYRAMRQRQQNLYDSGAVDDSMKDKIILAGAVFTLVFVVFHTFTTRQEALAIAAERSRELSKRRLKPAVVVDERLAEQPPPSQPSD